MLYYMIFTASFLCLLTYYDSASADSFTSMLEKNKIIMAFINESSYSISIDAMSSTALPLLLVLV